MASIKQVARKETDLKQIVYSDLQTSFAIHPNKKDVTRLFNEDAVKRSIRNIILTNKGEKLMDPQFGSNINSLLFEQMTPATEDILKHYVMSAIENHEPRAMVLGVIVSALYDMNAYGVTVVFNTINTKEPLTMELLINRVR
jgi:phage baseplate assembly protein W